MLVAQTKSQRAGYRQHTLVKPVRLGRVSMKFMTVGILAALALLYLAQSTQGASRSYELRDLNQQKADLKVQQDRLQVESIRLRSLDNLQKDFTTVPAADGKPADWEQVKSVSYISNPNTPVAQK